MSSGGIMALPILALVITVLNVTPSPTTAMSFGSIYPSENAQSQLPSSADGNIMNSNSIPPLSPAETALLNGGNDDKAPAQPVLMAPAQVPGYQNLKALPLSARISVRNGYRINPQQPGSSMITWRSPSLPTSSANQLMNPLNANTGVETNAVPSLDTTLSRLQVAELEQLQQRQQQQMQRILSTMKEGIQRAIASAASAENSAVPVSAESSSSSEAGGVHQQQGGGKLYTRSQRSRSSGDRIQKCGRNLLRILENECMLLEEDYEKRSLENVKSQSNSNRVSSEDWQTSNSVISKAAGTSKRNESPGLSLVESCCYQSCTRATLLTYCYHFY